MKTLKFNLASILILFFFSTLFAQEGWFWQNPLPQGNNLNDVFIFDDNSAIAVGNSGTIINMKSNGQIEQIHYKLNGIDAKFNCLYFANKDTGWIGGDGFILKTSDGGESWIKTIIDSVDFLLQYENIFFVNDSIGWISGTGWGWGWRMAIILRTTDGGENWKVLTSEEEFWFGYISDFYFINTTTGWISTSWETDISGGSNLWKTIDGGDTWMDIYDERLNHMFFINDTLGWGGRNRQIVKTIDGGYTWQMVIDSVNSTEVCFIDAHHGWVLIDSDSIIYTEDGGESWQGQNFKDSYIFRLNSVCFKPDGYGIAVGNGGHIRIKLPESSEWNSITTTCLNGSIKGLQVLNENNIWACGWNYDDYDYSEPLGNTRVLLNSTDGGDTWEKTLFKDSYNSKLNDIFFVNEQIGWAVGQNNITMNTRDGGSTWEYQNSGFVDNNLIIEKVFFVDSLNGWILGNPWSNITYLFSTEDGGETWSYIQNIIPSSFWGVDFCFVNKNDGWLVGYNGSNTSGEIYFTKNNGRTWQISKRTNDYSYKSVQFLDSLVGWVAGDSEILFTENGGEDWETIFTNPNPISDFIFLNQNYGWVIISNVGWTEERQYINGYIPTYLYITDNGGQSWHEYNTIPTPFINKIAFADENTGWIVGSNGAILKTNNAGITAFPNEPEGIIINPENFQLSQNYPNPFNPSTTIEFSLPKSEFVELKVYNLIGKEVATLVSNKLNQGNHNYTFDGKNLASGVYYYQLVAGDYREVKKMILLR